ncbi:DUF2489 domain-containing protein [Photobacterium galatheae]|uniref:Coproporphyrinogen III oxidase n=1 Tax=Photobacterium galatheae TaxID=1654360 RepID=A0A066RSS6_9GAMM|nr:DUF2489 domain-containing protein [Photobacterium galatheae]KDM92141.1 coproporphyrinogen III oxidase [Photobacterium galatheae]MCM0150988.1 DUF2489 domain-containing protein [Photobacterium galatheae]
MQDLKLWLLVAGSLIVLALASYAGYLLYQLYLQKQRHKAFIARAEQQQAEAIVQRNTNILESVYIIAEAGKQEQCDMSEIAIRLYKLMTVLQAERSVNFSAQYPALYELYTVVEEMPRGDERKAMPKQDRMRDDMVRMKAESRLFDAIQQELAQILAQKA